jgi:hypothetical protein
MKKMKKNLKIKKKKKKYDENFYLSNKNYKEFKSRIWNIHQRGEKYWEQDDEVIVESTKTSDINITCPLSKSQFESKIFY